MSNFDCLKNIIINSEYDTNSAGWYYRLIKMPLLHANPNLNPRCLDSKTGNAFAKIAKNLVRSKYNDEDNGKNTLPPVIPGLGCPKDLDLSKYKSTDNDQVIVTSLNERKVLEVFSNLLDKNKTKKLSRKIQQDLFNEIQSNLSNYLNDTLSSYKVDLVINVNNSLLEVYELKLGGNLDAPKARKTVDELVFRAIALSSYHNSLPRVYFGVFSSDIKVKKNGDWSGAVGSLFDKEFVLIEDDLVSNISNISMADFVDNCIAVLNLKAD